MPFTTFHHFAAADMAARSRDPSTKVGCVIVNQVHGATVGAGFNHFPPGVPDEWWQDRPRKYQAVVHAEAAAILAAGPRAKGADMYVTQHPCVECAKLIIEAGIRTVHSPTRPWRDDDAIRLEVDKAAELLKLCGVRVIGSEA